MYSLDGRTLALVEMTGGKTGLDIWTLTDDTIARPLIQTSYQEYHPRFSPDGRWLAYTSNQKGKPQVFVQSYPVAGRPIPVSPDGGDAPVWHPLGGELFFRLGDAIYSVKVGQGATPVFGEPRLERRVPGLDPGDEMAVPYDISPDGSRLIVMRSWPRPLLREFRVVLGVRPGR